jgi:hypothetical protein
MQSWRDQRRTRCAVYSQLADAVASSATAGSDITTSSFVTGALRELSVVLAKQNEVVYREALHVHATAGGTTARSGATVPTMDPA